MRPAFVSNLSAPTLGSWPCCPNVRKPSKIENLRCLQQAVYDLRPTGLWNLPSWLRIPLKSNLRMLKDVLVAKILMKQAALWGVKQRTCTGIHWAPHAPPVYFRITGDSKMQMSGLAQVPEKKLTVCFLSGVFGLCNKTEVYWLLRSPAEVLLVCTLDKLWGSSGVLCARNWALVIVCRARGAWFQGQNPSIATRSNVFILGDPMNISIILGKIIYPPRK